MTSACDPAEAYLDHTLSDLDRVRFERHLVGCARCAAAIEDYMQLVGAGAELARRGDRPLGVPLRRAGRARWAVAAVGVAAAVAAALLALNTPEVAVGDQIAATLLPARAMRERLPYAPLDRYRPYDVPRGDRPVEPIPGALMAKVEARGDSAALLAVLLARGDVAQALRVAGAPGAQTSDELAIERALLAGKQRPATALRHLDEVRLRTPRNGVAAWNRALVLADLHLPLAAAEALTDVVALSEPGWSIEAVQRATDLQRAEAARLTRWHTAKQACDRLTPARLPDREVIRAAAPVCRPAFYEAVRLAASRAELSQLATVAEVLDAAAGNTAAAALLHRVTAADPALRARAVVAYRALLAAAPADQGRWLTQLRASRQDDLLLGAIARLRLRPSYGEYQALARASQDPYFAEYAEQLTAEALVADEDPLGAEVVLRRAVRACTARDVELRCALLQLALTDLYETMHRPSEIRAVAQAAIRRSQQLGLYWDERQFFNSLAEAARFDGEPALMRAYLREATLRSQRECTQDRYVQETLAQASLDQLGFAQARRDVDAAPLCGEPPTREHARILAELARIDGTPAEAADLRRDVAQLRAQPDVRPGVQAYLDALEGRLLAITDPAAARPLLRRAIATADRGGLSDAEAAKARHDAYTALLVLAAGEADRAASLALLAEAAGAPLGAGCTIGAMVDGERVLVLARDATGAITQHFDAKGRTTPALDAATLVPPALVGALAGCARIDAVALAPVFGLPGLLPPELAWSYRGRPQAITAPPARAPRVVTVADAVPPPELELAPLHTLTLAPIPGAIHDELRGAEATPARAAGAFPAADAIEIHAHGFVDLGVSDASLLALSPQADGRFTLGAREIAALRLPRAPVVLLAACHAAYTAPYFHESWGLPRAFLLAGARAVLASPDTISDAEAGGFFRAVEQRILAGVDPAIALRDERRTRLARDPTSWTRAVLLFD